MMRDVNDTGWPEVTVSLCDSPVAPLSKGDIVEGHPALEFCKLWQELGQGQAPCRNDFKPSQAKSLLRWLFIFDAMPDDPGREFYLRLVGTAAVALMHEDFTGKYLREFTTHDCHQSRHDRMMEALNTGQPKFAETDVSASSEYKLDVQIGFFPFRNVGGRPAQVFGVVAPIDNRKYKYFV